MPEHELRNKIITIAETLFIKNNYEDISVREVSHLSGISIGSFYRHIGSKEKLFEIFLYKFKTDITEALSDKIINKNGISKIKILFNVYLDTILKYGHKCTAFYLALSLEEKKLFCPTTTLYTYLKNYVDEAGQNNEFHEKYNSDYVFKALYFSLRGAVFDWCTYRGNTDLKKDFTLTSDILLNKFKK